MGIGQALPGERLGESRDWSDFTVLLVRMYAHICAIDCPRPQPLQDSDEQDCCSYNMNLCCILY